jgi:hypothetical protein
VPAEELLVALKTQLTGKELQFPDGKEGIVHLPVGKFVHSRKMLDNIDAKKSYFSKTNRKDFGKEKVGVSVEGTSDT